MSLKDKTKITPEVRRAVLERDSIDGCVYTIYMHRNKTNGMCYVGQTRQKPEDRWDWGCGYKAKRGSLLGAAIKEFGWGNFEHIILETGLTAEEANAAERKYIAEYNTITPNGYNTESGGKIGYKFSEYIIEKERNRKPWTLSEETKKKMSEARKRKWQDPEYRAKITPHLKANSEKIAANKDKYYTPERRAKQSEVGKRTWEESSEEKKARMLSGLKRRCGNEQDGRENGNL